MTLRIANHMERYLAPGETLQAQTGPHWIVNLRSIVSSVMILAVGVALVYEAMHATSSHATIFAALAIGSVGIAIAILVSANLQRRSQLVLVTDSRIVELKGIMHRSMSEVRIAAVQSTKIDQSVLGRLLNFGTVTLETGNDDPLVLANIAFPQELYQVLLDHRPHETRVALRA